MIKSKFLGILLSVSLSVCSQTLPTEWCPKGTWWTYKMQYMFGSRYREHELYIYKGDTLVNSLLMKKIDVHRFYTDMVFVNDTTVFDSITRFDGYKGYCLLFKQNDSVFGLYSFNSFVDLSGETNKFRFLYKFNSKKGDTIKYYRKAIDTFYCVNNNSKKVIHSGVLSISNQITDSIQEIDYIVNNQSRKIKVTYTSSLDTSIFGYKYIYENLAPSEYMVNAPNITNYIEIQNKILDSLSKVYSCQLYKRSFGTIYSSSDDIKLWCYNQGTEGIYIDRHYGGLTSGCEYIRKSLIENLSNENKITEDNLLISPNPIFDYLTFYGFSDIEYKVLIFDSRGILVKNLIINEIENEVSTFELSEGVYFIKILDSKSNVVLIKKIVKAYER